ncbi:phage putative head morphogenesis protein, SPP1 gp7 family [Alteribacillus persepolensis]|uniref:Phage putative head morphogenesis protein, SPP1 gp7 family n=2 Tax=Alteribacillus persepolensis TaxID=568899 RepID=A0A1G8IA59_9BACI|nr:phage putative head morphogenesis protein, SPP1 gp7 family [Alteribacillus persepolensis]
MKERLEQLTDSKEREVARRYARLLRDIQQLISKRFEKYEKDGQLTYEEMVKYDRLKKLQDEIVKVVNAQETGMRNVIYAHLSDQYKEAYYRTGHIFETEALAMLGYSAVKDEVVDEIINTDFTGLTLNERLSRRRGELIMNMRETITRGLREGQTYRSMSRLIQDELEIDRSKAQRIVRTESHRVRESASLESAKHAQKKGIVMMKTWNTVSDSRVRDSHDDLGGKKVEKVDGTFNVGGMEAEMPSDASLPASESINCRCFITYEIQRVEKPQHDELADLSYDEWRAERLG